MYIRKNKISVLQKIIIIQYNYSLQKIYKFLDYILLVLDQSNLNKTVLFLLKKLLRPVNRLNFRKEYRDFTAYQFLTKSKKQLKTITIKKTNKAFFV
jgi:hypothetical protein